MRRGDLGRIALLAAAMLWTGQAYAGVKEGVDAWQAGNYAKAVAEWKGPADQGDADAQFNLGQAYKLGRGVPADGKIAQSWYLKAAQQNHEQAQANLGLMMFQSGDRQNAMPWIRKAADHGEPRAQYVLGTALFNGDLLDRDWPRAYALMTRAAAAGLPQAATSLQQMDQYISPADRQAGIALAQQLEKGTAVADAKSVAPGKPAIPVKPVAVPPSTNVTKPVPSRQTAAAKVAARKTDTPAPPAKLAAAPSSKPAPETPPPAKNAPARSTPAAPAKGSWRIQLGAYGSPAAAEKAWGAIAGKDAVKGQQPSYTPVKTLTRLQAGPYAGKADANKACEALQKSGQNCFPVAP